MSGFASFTAVTAVAALMLGGTPSHAAPLDQRSHSPALEASAQATSESIRRRPRARVRVYPLYPRQDYISLYPLPYDTIAYPGPNAVRRCDVRLVQDHRPSGTVIVPRQRCWWAPR